MARPLEDRPLLQTVLFPIAARFVAGDNVHDALQAIARLNGEGLATTVDILGEDIKSFSAVDRVAAQYRSLMESLARRRLDANISLKLSALGQRLDRSTAITELENLLDHAASTMDDPFVRIDMEGYALLQDTLDAFETVWATRKNTGLVLQAQLRRTPEDVAHMIALGARTRLCKGAYREPPSVAVQTSTEIRAQFLTCAEALLRDGRYPAIATHDSLLIEQVRKMVDRLHGDRNAFEFQLLYGVRTDLQRALVADGFRVRVYVPFGSHWAKYFRRRVMERRENLFFAMRALVSR
jgi:proline dehydrogenase